MRAALDLFSRDGYERTSVDAISAQAGVSKRTVYNHFGDKESLFLAVVQQTFGRMIGLTDEILQRHLGDIRDQSAVEPRSSRPCWRWPGPSPSCPSGPR